MRTLAMSGTLSLSILPTSSSNLHLPLSTIRISDPAFSIALPVKVRNPNLGYSSKILNSPSSNAAANNYDNNDNIDGHSSVESANPYFFSSTDTFKMPTAPWMKGLPFLEPDQVKALSKPKHRKNSHIDENGKPGPSLTDRISGGRGKKAMKMIIQSVENLQAVDSSEETYRREMEFEFDTSLEQFWGDRDSKIGRKVPWLKDERLVFRRTKKEKVATAAELSLDGTLLERLRREAGRMRKWVKVNKAGVTPSVVDQIRFIWKNNELAMLQLDIPLCRNMDRAREIVEMKTGGLVVWCRKDKLVIYRGSNYRLTSNYITEMHPCSPRGQGASSLNGSWHVSEDTVASSQGKSNEGAESEKISGIKGYEENIQVHKSLFEREADRLLGGLGPRFIDWWRPKPLPVDADLLPEVVPGFRPPFRLCPPHTRPKLNDDELTYLRKLARPLPTHFVLGRNRKLQGLAVAILKLWERCHIAKIAVKLGIPNTNNEQMAYELKCLTGGVLLLRNKFFIILYRGKDFLPSSVANIVVEREMELKRCQIQEEAVRLQALDTFYATEEALPNNETAGTLSEFQGIHSKYGYLKNGDWEVDLQLKSERERLEKELRNQERKLFILKSKIQRSSKELTRLNSAWSPAEQDTDKEIITEEEREGFRRIGLKMDGSLVLGRRGVFDGVIEGLHQHWKHREIVKVITMQRVLSQVIHTAKMLEAESGGILVSVDEMKEGHAIIIYRGKNYKRPLKLMPQNLLTKREALSRSLEMQRIGSLKFFACQRERAISDLKHKLADLLETRGQSEESLRSSQM